MSQTGIFKSAEGEQVIRNWYARFLARLPYAVETRQIETPLGRTQVLVAGPADAQPLVVLHGAMAGAPYALGEMADLAHSYRVYAVDVIGQSVASAQVRPKFNDDSYARWLGAVLDGLGLPRAALLAISWGGAVALNLAQYAPERIAALVLVVPAGIVRGPVWAAIRKVAWPMLLYNMRPTVERRDRALAGIFTQPDPEFWSPYIGDAFKHYRMDFNAPPLLKPQQMAQLQAPVYVYAADQDLSFPGQVLLRRASELFPNYAGGHLFSNCLHSPPFTDDFRRELAARIRQVLSSMGVAPR